MRTLLAMLLFLTLALVAPIAAAEPHYNEYDECGTTLNNPVGGADLVKLCNRGYETDSDPTHPGGDWCSHSTAYIWVAGHSVDYAEGVDANRPTDNCGPTEGAVCYGDIVYYDNDPLLVGMCGLKGRDPIEVTLPELGGGKDPIVDPPECLAQSESRAAANTYVCVLLENLRDSTF